MIEVEAKVSISEPAEYRKRAAGIAKFEGRVKKIDDYYTLEPRGKYPRKSLRIRKAGRHSVINFKERISYVGGVHAKRESEFAVSDVNGFLKLIKDFGFRKWLRKEKDSESYKIRNNFHIEINRVKNLGWFLEIEHLASSRGEIAGARKEVLKVLDMLKIDRKRIVKDGYTKMLWDRGIK